MSTMVIVYEKLNLDPKNNPPRKAGKIVKLTINAIDYYYEVIEGRCSENGVYIKNDEPEVYFINKVIVKELLENQPKVTSERSSWQNMVDDNYCLKSVWDMIAKMMQFEHKITLQ